MEWLILLLLVPAIVVPVVLSMGFAGCGFSVPGAGPPTLQFVSATPLLSPSRVELAWTSTDGGPVTFKVRRRKGSEQWLPPVEVEPNGGPGQPHTFVDPPLQGVEWEPLQPGTTYSYGLQSIRTADGSDSLWSADADVKTYALAFSSGLPPSGFDEPVTRDCVVQRLSPGSLSHGGNLIAITLIGPTNGELVLSHVTVSRPALAGDDYDSASSPVDLTNMPVILHPGIPERLPPGEIKVEADEALLIAFDIETVGHARLARGVAHTAYIKRAPNVDAKITEAGTQNRAGFTEQPNELWFVDTISIATKWPQIS
jgi:hypothetical protein